MINKMTRTVAEISTIENVKLVCIELPTDLFNFLKSICDYAYNEHDLLADNAVVAALCGVPIKENPNIYNPQYILEDK